MGALQDAEKKKALENLTLAIQRAHASFYRESLSSGANGEAFEQAAIATTRELSDQVMTMLATMPSGSAADAFETIMTTAIANTMERSQGGEVCPCCGEAWGHG